MNNLRNVHKQIQRRNITKYKEEEEEVNSFYREMIKKYIKYLHVKQ